MLALALGEGPAKVDSMGRWGVGCPEPQGEGSVAGRSRGLLQHAALQDRPARGASAGGAPVRKTPSSLSSLPGLPLLKTVPGSTGVHALTSPGP